MFGDKLANLVKVLQNIVSQWYKVVSLSGNYEMIMISEKVICSLFIMLK